MELETLFSVASTGVLAGWLGLLLAPSKYRLWRPLAVVVALALCMLYAGLIGAFWTSGEGDFSSLAGVAKLFAHPGSATRGLGALSRVRSARGCVGAGGGAAHRPVSLAARTLPRLDFHVRAARLARFHGARSFRLRTVQGAGHGSPEIAA